MGHAICAVLLKGPFDAQLAERYDLFGIALAPEITMFHIDHYYTACWQKQLNVQGNLEGVVDCAMFPSEAIVHILMAKVSGTLQPIFAVILTDYVWWRWAAMGAGLSGSGDRQSSDPQHQPGAGAAGRCSPARHG